MLSTKFLKNLGAYFVFSLIILVFIAVLIFAALLVRHSFFSAVPTAAPPAPPKETATSVIAGRYAGYTTLQTGICSIGVHELVIEVDEGGNAKSSYGMKADKFLTGTAVPNGRVKLTFRENGTTILFDGTIQDGHITGTSSASNDKTCTIYWDLARN